MKKNFKILMAATEVAPIVKVGGLADVVGSLPPALKNLGCDVRLIIPLYGCIDTKKYRIKKIISDINIASKGRNVKVNIWAGKLPKTSVKIYFIDAPKYFKKNKVYYGSNSERFLFFSLALLQSLSLIKFNPDIIHCHDYHTALTIDILKSSVFPSLDNIKTVFTIHNLNHQGASEIEVLSTGKLSKESLSSLSRDAQDGDINFMVQGIINSDLVNTVSPTYAKEIVSSFYGAGIEKIIKKNKNKISGILNGIDVDFFNPTKDKNIKRRYSYKSLKKKTVNKLFLQKNLGLTVDKNVPIAALISRLVWQKGIELINEDFLKLDCQYVILGTGQKKYEKYLKKLSKKFPKKFSANILFDAQLAQQIYAGADIFLMPSRFEPCGLGQMIAMRYGTVPVVRDTGGLADTVNNKVGFKFKNFDSSSFFKIMEKALEVYRNNPKKWEILQVNGMKKDFSWDNSAVKYLELYKKLVRE